jgi:hypothetical protein
MSTTRILRTTILAALGAAASLAAPAAWGDSPQGTASIYRGIPQDQVEVLTSPDRIKAVVSSGAPTAIWQALEHGEKVECLDCIPAVLHLILPENGAVRDAKTREIAAWWLRRRIFGVFGPGEAYSQIVDAVAHAPSPAIRAAAADALGEFLEGAGVAPVATALVSDPDASVRTAAAHALGRLNDVGPNGELSKALSDADDGVRLAAVQSAGRINMFTDVVSVAKLLSDSSPTVRRHAASLLGQMRAKDAVLGLAAIASPSNEPDARTRAEAVNALGLIADPAGKDAVTAAATDPDPFVRDAAAIALRRL